MSGPSEVIHRGTKVFWKVRSTVDVIIIRHRAMDVLEIVCTDPVRNRECGRLYVNESALRDRVSEKLFVTEQKEHLSKKGPNQDGAMVPIGVELTTNETVNFILDRLHVESYDPKSRIYQIEMLEHLATEEISSSDTDGVVLLCPKPAALVPFSASGTIVNDKEEVKVVNKTPTLVVETKVTMPAGIAAPESPKSPKSPKANVPRIELTFLRDEATQSTQEHTHSISPPLSGQKNKQNEPRAKSTQQKQQVPRHNTSHLQVHTADALEADFHVYHGRRDQNHKPFVTSPLSSTMNTVSSSNPSTARANNAHTPITSPVISPRPANNLPHATGPTAAVQFTPRKGKNHYSVLQSIHNSQNVQAAEQRHARQQVHVQHSNYSHSVGSSHLSPIPLPDQLTKVTTHPTLPPNRNLTPHQEPLHLEGPIVTHKKKHHKSLRTRMREAGAAFGRFFGFRRNRKVHSGYNAPDHVPVLNAHNEVLLVKTSEANRRMSNASTDSTGAAGSTHNNYNSGLSSIPKHMQVPLQGSTTPV